MKSVLFLLFTIAVSSHAFATNEDSQEIRLCYEDVSVHPWITGDMKGLVIQELQTDRKSTRLNASHISISYAVF